MIRMFVAALALLALMGCAAGGSYQRQESYTAPPTSVPPSFYDNDPAYRHWWTGPDWNPEILGRSEKAPVFRAQARL